MDNQQRITYLLALQRCGLDVRLDGERVMLGDRELPIRNQQADEAEPSDDILVYGPIVDDETRSWLKWLDITSMSGPAFRAALDASEGDITVRIDSPGGDVSQASMIQGSISEYINSGRGKVNAVVEGMAFSAASLITLPMSSVAMYQLAETMIHGPIASLFGGDARDFRKVGNRLLNMENEIISSYASKNDQHYSEQGRSHDS